MDRYKITQVVRAPSQQDAVYIANEQSRPRNLGVPYVIEDQKIEPMVPIWESSVIDRIIKKAIAGAIMLYVSKSLKDWAKE